MKELLDLIETKLSDEPWFVVGKLSEIINTLEKRIFELEYVEEILKVFQQIIMREDPALYQKIVKEINETSNSNETS